MTTTSISMGIAILMTVGLISTLGLLSLLAGGVSWFGANRPKLTFLKSAIGAQGLALGVKWNQARWDEKFDRLELVLYNPFGSPTRLELSEKFPAQDNTFAIDIDFGPAFEKLIAAKGTEQATVEIKLIASKSKKGPLTFSYNMNAADFVTKRSEAENSLADYEAKHQGAPEKPPVFGVPTRSFIADTVPGKGPKLKIPTNPEFAGEFAAAGAAAGGAPAGEAVANFAMKKVWIIDGCIVCNACEDIYPEVFDVQSDTCIVRPNPPLDDGLKIVEAAEACPVEVIKFEKA